jgi:hypothetical protein
MLMVIRRVRIPGFTAESSLFSASTQYRYLGKKYHSSMQAIISQTRQLSSTERWKIPEPQKEPAMSGQRAWMDLERACNNLQCEACRSDCLSFINGLHDAINIKLGKPVRTPNDLLYLRDFINSMTKHAVG